VLIFSQESQRVLLGAALVRFETSGLALIAERMKIQRRKRKRRVVRALRGCIRAQAAVLPEMGAGGAISPGCR
jgi:hypothetical protein